MRLLCAFISYRGGIERTFNRNASVKNLDSTLLRRLAERVARKWEVPPHPLGRVRIMKVS